MIERHYDDEALVTMLDAGAHASDPHLGACGECSEKLDSFRLVVDALHDAATWDKRDLSDAPNPRTIATLRSFADTMAAEDSAAEAYLADLLAGPREGWMTKLRAHPEYRTAGTVRKLIAATDRALDTMPADAVEITALATEIAEHLDPATHRPDTLARLRGAAWRERAYALFYTGQFGDAEKAVDTAERHFGECVVDEYELARVGIVRAVVERGLEKYADGLATARRSADRFEDFVDNARAASARIAEAQLQCSTADFAAAFSTLLQLEEELRHTGPVQTQALVLGNLGYCAWKLGRVGEAIQFHQNAALILEDLGMESDAIRAKWNIAVVLATNGNIDEALRRLRLIQEEFTNRGMAGAAADVALEMAELLVARSSYAEAKAICHDVMQYVQTAGLAHTAPALKALALIHEAVNNQTATPAVVKRVREYLQRLPNEPTLLFATLPQD
jgi:tetratricopeptide (TPR) repeat protein